MPNYGMPQAGGTLTALQPGDSMYLFNAEAPAAPQASIAFARGYSPSGDDSGITFQILFAAAPTAQVVIQASNVDADANYQTVFTSTNLQNDNYTDTVRWKFYRAKLVSQSAGGALTLIASR
jgi:hypothetical protein